MSEKFLITGGQGFFGAWIARRLVAQGVPTVLLDLSPDNTILSQVLDPDALPELGRVFADVSDADKVRRIVAEEEITHVIHLAAVQTPACQADPVRGAKVNVIGTLAIFEAARALSDQVKMVVYASSAAVAGAVEDYGEGPVADTARHRPRTQYGVFKAANEGNARCYFDEHGIPSVGLRPYTCYGVGREVGMTSAITKAIKSAVLGRSYTIPFAGRNSFVLMEDLAEVFVRVARSASPAARAHFVRGHVASILEFLEALRGVLPESGFRIECDGDQIPVAYDFDEAGLQDLLGGPVPRTPLTEGIERTARQFEELAHAGRLHDRDLT